MAQLASALEEERRTSEQLRSEIAALKNPPPRERLPFPGYARPEAKDPAQFRRVAERALAECAPGLTLEAVDCTEYPCIGWARKTAPDSAPSRLILSECAPWKEVFGNRTAQHMQGIKADDGGIVRRLAFFAFSEGDDESTMREMSESADERIKGYFEPLQRRP